MIKKIFLGIVILIFLVVIAVAIFIATFDAEKFRPIIESKLQEIAGNPVTIGALDLNWNNGIAFEMDQIAIHGPGKVGAGSPRPGEETLPVRQAGSPLLAIQRIYAFLEPLPLLNKDLKIGSLVIEGLEVHVTRNAQGEIVVSGIKPPSGKKEGDGASPLLSFLVSSLTLKDSFIRFTDNSRPIPMDLAVRKLDVNLKDVSLTRPWSFKVSAALFSEMKNFAAEGRFFLPFAGRPARLEDLEVDLDLNDVDLRQLQVAVPEIRELEIPDGGLKGKLDLEFPTLELSENALNTASANLKFSGGAFASKVLPAPVENLNVNARLQSAHVDLESFHLKIAGGTVDGQGTANRLLQNPEWALKLQVQGMNLEQLQTNLQPHDPAIHGNLSATFEGNAVGMTLPLILQSLKGQGSMALTDGVIRNMNILREIFDKLSLIPGLMTKLRERLPQDYSAKLEARDTVLGSVNVPFGIQNGFVLLEQLNLMTESFQFAGGGSVRLDGPLAIQGVIRIEPDLSLAIIKSVNELQNLTDQQGQLEIPIVINKSVGGKLIVLPDLRYIASRIAVTKAQEWIGGLLGVPKTPAPTAQDQVPSTDPQSSTPSDTQDTSQDNSLEGLLGGYLQKALEKK